MDKKDMIRVKLIGNIPSYWFKRQIPEAQEQCWGNCRFTFDVDDKEYDWLVVYNDLPQNPGERRSTRMERLSCRPCNTLLITTEPPNIKVYESAFTDQFGYVLTCHEEWALCHPHRIYSAPAVVWYYGLRQDGTVKNYEGIRDDIPLRKTKIISTTCANKRQRHTLHNQRFIFTQKLKELIPELDAFGMDGVRVNMEDALDDYKYHVTVENYITPHYITEKLPGAILGGALCFYYGAPNVADYFPKDSFIPIDIFDVEGSVKVIRQVIENNEYEKRLPAIMEARRFILEKGNLFAVVSRIVEENNNTPNKNRKLKEKIRSRRNLIMYSPLNAFFHVYHKLRLRIICMWLSRKSRLQKMLGKLP